MLASREGNENACKNLISFGCQLDCQDSCGYTALMYACREGHLPVARILLLSGADASLSTPFGYNSLLIASLNGFGDLTSLLCSYVSPNVTDEDGLTPLACACKNNHALTVSVLLDHGADLSIRDSQGRSPIMYAIDNNSFSVLDQLLQRNIFLEYDNSKQLGVVYVAALHHNRYLAEFLVGSPLYIEEFLDDLTRFPHLPTAFFIEYAVYGAIRQRRLEPEMLASILVERAKNSAMLLMEHYMRGHISFNVSGLVETCLWCLRVCKIGCGPEGVSEMRNMEFFWRFVENVVGACTCCYSVRQLKRIGRKNEGETDVDEPVDIDIETENEMSREQSRLSDRSVKTKDEIDHTIEIGQPAADHTIEIDDSVDPTIAIERTRNPTMELSDPVDRPIELHNQFYHPIHPEQASKASLVPASLPQMKLLFFFLELYCLGLSVLRASFAMRRTTCQPSSRLFTFFSANKLFLK